MNDQARAARVVMSFLSRAISISLFSSHLSKTWTIEISINPRHFNLAWV